VYARISRKFAHEFPIQPVGLAGCPHQNRDRLLVLRLLRALAACKRHQNNN
jgi:hypothetical protein